MIYLDENGVTVKAQRGAKVGQEYELNGQNYLVVDRDLLEDMVNKGKDVSKVVTTRVKMMLNLFCQKNKFNQDIGSWDVSNVYSMTRMFRSAECFNQDISFWDVTGTRQMEEMFLGASSFNNDISNWDVKNVENMRYMFANTKKFNQPIGKWNIGSYADISYMFYFAESFNQDLSNWDVSRSNPISLFEGAASFNQDLKNWKFAKWGKGHSCNRMFKNAISFNGDISSWDVFGITHMDEMFMGAQSFNQDISSWDVSKVIKMDRMFSGATSFNCDISKWNVLNVKNASAIFKNAEAFYDEYNPFPKKIKEQKSIKKNDAGIELSSEDKNAISKIKKLLVERDFDKIDFGLELLISLNNVKLFETLLHGCKIELTYSYGEKTDKLIRNEFFTGTAPAQPYLNYALFCIIAHAPEEAEIDKSIVRKNMTSLDLKIFFSEYDLPNKFLPLDKFSALSKLKIDFNIFKVNYNGVDKKINREDWFVNNKITDLELSNTSGSLKWFKNFSHLKSLKFGFGYYGYPIENIESFEYLDNLEELYLENINEYKQVYNDIDFLKKCKKIKKFHLKIKDCYSIENIDVIKNFSELEELYINGISSELNLEALLSCEKLKNISLRSNHKIDLDYKLFKNCVSLETLKLYGFKPFDVYGRISEIGGLKGLVNLNKISFGSFNFIGINNGSLMIESNTKINKPTSINEDNQCVKDQDIADNDIIMNHADSLYVAVMPELSSEDRKALSEIKKLLTTRDYDKIDVGIEKLISLNNVKLFETLLYGCKIELTQTNFYGNQMTNKLRRNEFFTGTGPAQPYLNYALFCIIANAPEGAGIDKSLVQKNMTSLDLKVFFLDYDLPNKFLPIDKFSVLSTLKIDFTIFTEMNKGVNKNLIRDDWFVNNNIIELELSKTSGSLKWFKNFTQLKSLKFWFGYYPIENIENFEYLENLEELYLYTINQYEQIYKNVDFLNKCNRIKKFHLVNKSLENIDVIKNFHELEELNISEIRSELNLEALLSCEKLKKLSIKARNFDFELIKNCAALETLNLSDDVECNLSGKIIDINQLKGLNNLKHLTIDNVEIKGIDNKIFF